MARFVVVAKGDVLFQNGAAVAQDEFREPLHAGDPIDIADPDFGAVLFLPEAEIHGRHCVAAVRNRKIPLNAERDPRAANPDIRLLDGGVSPEDRVSVQLVDAGIKMPAQIGKETA